MITSITSSNFTKFCPVENWIKVTSSQNSVIDLFLNFQTSEGLGIMIIEGSHKVLGKGIYISDIQRNSLAFKVS